MPAASMRSRMWSISASVTLGLVTMIMGDSHGAFEVRQKTKATRVIHGSLGWCAVY
jgi:uncharacterized membrane protein